MTLREPLLLSAYQCGPGMGSVSQIGWEWYQRVASHATAEGPVTLVTHVRNRDALEQAGAPLDHTEVKYIDTEWFAGPLFRFASKLFPRSEHAVFLVSSLDVYVWDAAAVRWARRELKRRRRDDEPTWSGLLAPTPVTSLGATRLTKLPLRSVLGPLNSGLATPEQFADLLDEDSSWIYETRRLAALWTRLRGALRAADVILIATEATQDSLPRKLRSRAVPLLENGVELDRFQPSDWPRPPGPDQPLRLTFVGRLVPFKAVGLLLKACARFVNGHQVQVRIVGEGPMREIWEAQAREYGLSKNVSFLGNRPLDEVPEHMAWAHAFCLPSVRESGGAVLLEAMACCRPTIAVAYGGPADLVDDEVGRALAPTSSDDVVDQLERALCDLWNEPETWRQRGLVGRRRVEQLYSWSAKVEQAIDIVQNDHRADRAEVATSPGSAEASPRNVTT